MPRHPLCGLLALALLLALASPARAQDAPPPPPEDLSFDEPVPAPRRSPPAPRRTTPAKAKTADTAAVASDDSPVVRGGEGTMGMFFRLGGLAFISLQGDANLTGTAPAAVLSNEIGMKFVFSEKLMLPVFFGLGIWANDPDGDDNGSTNWNMAFGAGIEYHFRIWRRISPFFGGFVHFGFSDETGDDNLLFTFGMGPSLGVEYYIGDRLSLAASYVLLIHITHQTGSKTNTVQISTGNSTRPAATAALGGLNLVSGGQLTLTFYF